MALMAYRNITDSRKAAPIGATIRSTFNLPALPKPYHTLTPEEIKQETQFILAQPKGFQRFLEDLQITVRKSA